MGAQHAAAALGQHLEIAAGLCPLDDLYGVLVARHREILDIVAGDLREDSRVRSSLVSLPGRVLETWTEAEARCHPLPVAHGETQRLKLFFMGRAHLDVGERREVVSDLQPVQMGPQPFGERSPAAGSRS